jgi:CubicO group peptidase (beta-lactamase class C family)
MHRMTTYASTALVAAMVAATPIAAQVGPANPAVDAIFAAWDSETSPGCALGVYRDGRVIYSRGYGMADLERRVPITPHTVFDIGSTSKQFAAASVVLLSQDGRLSLDDDVRRHIPELPEYERPITIRHLLHHTSGLRDYIGLLTMGGHSIDGVTTAEDALDAIVRQRQLNFAPGDEHLYSNSGYFLLSIIVERVAGESLRDFARHRIFEPLGMRRTHYLGSYNDVVPDRALAYAPHAGGGVRTDMSRWLQLGDGAVFTTVEELLLWDNNFHDPKVGGMALLEALHQRGRLTSGDSINYALGLGHARYRGLRTVSHGGAWGGYRADLMRFPEQRFSVATLCNLGTINPTPLAQRVADVFLADVLEAPAAPAAPAPTAAPAAAPAPAAAAAAAAAAAPAPAAAAAAATPPAAVTVPESTLRALAGSWRSPTGNVIRDVAFQDGALYLLLGRRFELRPTSATEFTVLDAPVAVTITFEVVDGAQRMRWNQAGQSPVDFVKLETVSLTPVQLEEYAGRYHSPELQNTFTVRVVDGVLTVFRRGEAPQPLQPRERDEFASGPVTLRFQRDAAGTITGYRMDMGRIRDLLFERSGLD